MSLIALEEHYAWDPASADNVVAHRQECRAKHPRGNACDERDSPEARNDDRDHGEHEGQDRQRTRAAV